ncbi:MAG: alpha/beta hydrolase [Deltaproteobacteria bacterium]|nr:alpha/beta hydrolase [Deltaproteobacteria bacterium]
MPSRAPIERRARDVAARGARLRVTEAGDEAGAPLVLLHGFMVSHLEFDDVIDLFARRFHVLAPDLPGFGESEKPSPARYAYGVETFAEAVVDLVAAYGLGRSSVVGHAMGGTVALTLAAHHPELVARLVLVDAICYPRRLGLGARLELLPVVGAVLFKQLYGRRRFRRYFQEQVFAPDAAVPPALVDRFYAYFNTPAARESAYAVLTALLDTRPVVARIARIRTPALVVWGRDDRVVPASFALRLAREIPGARLELLDAGHCPHAELPQEFVAAVSEFLEGKR